MQQTHVKLNTTATQTVITFTATENRRETYIHGCWNIGEPDPMASAQSKRFWALSAPADGPQSQFHGAAIPNDWPKRASAAAPEVMAG